MNRLFVKKASLAIAITSASSTALADIDYYAGLALNSKAYGIEATENNKSRFNGYSKKHEDNMHGAVGLGLTFGGIIDEKHRVAITLNNNSRAADRDEVKTVTGKKEKQKVTSKQALVSYDYMIPIMDSKKLKAFVGGTLGADKIDVEMTTANGKVHGKNTALTYGLQAGLNYRLTDNIAFETGVRSLATNHNIKKTLGSDTYKVKADSSGDFYLNVSYIF